MKLLRSLLVAFPALLVATLGQAQTGYPDKPISFLVGFTPGKGARAGFGSLLHHRAHVRAEAQ